MALITNLPTYPGSLSTSDVIPIVDIANNITRQCTVSQLREGLVTPSQLDAKLDKTGGTVLGQLTVSTTLTSNNLVLSGNATIAGTIISKQSAKAFADLFLESKTATFIRSAGSNIVTITMTAHGYNTGYILDITFSTTVASAHNFIVTSIIDANTFTVVSNATTAASGTASVKAGLRNAFNINAIAYVSTGIIDLFFTNSVSTPYTPFASFEYPAIEMNTSNLTASSFRLQIGSDNSQPNWNPTRDKKIKYLVF